MASSTASNTSLISSSSLAIFSKSLTKTDIKNKLSIPAKALKHLPLGDSTGKIYIEAKDDEGFFWSFRCSIRRNGHPKPVFSSKTWLPFVRFRNLRFRKLRVGDTIKLYNEYDQFTGVHYKIQVHPSAVNVDG